MVDSKAPLIIDIMKETVNTKKPEKLVWVDLEVSKNETRHSTIGSLSNI